MSRGSPTPGPRRRAAPRPVRATRSEAPGRASQRSNSTKMLIDALQLTFGACLSLMIGGFILGLLIVIVIYVMK
ncbi:hypothetical protein [Actinospica sp.]|jgi:hypothetical protein|uniref:hypothetical protein n=1 Tax=Actinospica sp. TaxID=1872142 RepID=UPI002CE1B3D6|nr:hypothetical protein [Actinospica sp.]HWG28418.1 hypothetical protein [Actinospica sp.]